MGSAVKGIASMGTFGLSDAFFSHDASKKALKAQEEAQERALAEQRKASEEAIKQQRLAQEESRQATEKASRANARLNTDVKDLKNSADLTGGIAKKANTKGLTLGSDDTLGLETEEEDWY